MKWLWNSRAKIPESSVTSSDIEGLKEKANDVAETVKKIEQATLDGEHTWMLVRCKLNEKPTCNPKGAPCTMEP